MSGSGRCAVCGNALDADERVVLAVGRRRVVHCSARCVGKTVRQQELARSTWRWRAILGGSSIVLVISVIWAVRLHRAPKPRAIALDWAETGWVAPVAPPPRGLNLVGPNWPPTDEDWAFAFGRVRWTYPLPGPERRLPTASGRLFAPEPGKKERAPICRSPKTCAATLGGELWGEHVYAVLDGVVDRAQGRGNDDRGGVYVRIAHFGGMVFTHYYHLAAVPRGVYRGARVSAGDVIGLLGDTGIRDEGPHRRPHLHFEFSIKPSNELGETFWDPVPLMANWSMRVPPHGTVAGLAAPVTDEESVRRRRGR